MGRCRRRSHPDWYDFLKDYVALVDWPGGSFWPELSASYPDALVLLSVREGESWYNSAIETIFKDDPEESGKFDRMWRAIVRTRFCNDFGNNDRMIAAMEAHNNAVRAAIPSERLLEYRAGEGWKPLCAALDLPIPEIDYPHTNTKKEFLERPD